MTPPPRFSTLLRQHRLAAGLSQEELAERAGLSTRAISDLERGIHRAPYRHTVDLLAGALNLSGDDLARFVASVARGRRAAVAGGAVARPPWPASLPAPLTSFIGRERELAEVRALLRGTRLLTLTGTGGVGKTRLALQATAEVRERYADGVWFVDLAPLAEPTLVPHSVAEALRVREEPGRAPAQTLEDYLRPRQVLLVLDNCEHLVAACAGLVDALLRACPGLRVLTTSREALAIAGETAYRVPSLSLPEFEDRALVETLMRCEAAQLFLDRAAAALPSFTVTDRNAPAVARICRRLDGIPLAIELAAARARVLAVDEIATRLDEGFRLLSGGSRTALPRQQTLQATLEWSYGLLPTSEQRLLQRLSIFAGGWDLAAAEAVCAGDGIDPDAVLDLLTGLVDKSLVLAEERDGAVRYRLLEMVRHFARAKLADAGDIAALRVRHRDYFLAFAERAEAQVEGPGQQTWLTRLETDHDNLRAALAWSREEHAHDAWLRLAGALWFFWTFRGHLHEGRRWLEEGLGRRAEVPPPVRAKALQAAGWLAFFQGDFARMAAVSAESLALCRQAGDARGIARARALLAVQAAEDGDLNRAAALFEESLARSRQVDDRWNTAFAANSLGYVAMYLGDYERAVPLFEECMALSRAMGDQLGVGYSLVGLGQIARRKGTYREATEACRQSLVVFRDIGERRGIAQSLEELAKLAVTLGRPERAARLLGAADAVRTAIGAPIEPAERPDHDDAVATARAALGSEAFAAAWATGRALPLAEAIAEALDYSLPGKGLD